MSERKAILGIGLRASPPGEDATAPGGRSAESIQAHVKIEMQKISAEGYDMGIYYVDPENENLIDELRAKIQEKKTWYGVAVGFGVRGHMEHTPLFEKIINTALAEIKPTPKLLFPLGPEDTYNAVKRVS